MPFRPLMAALGLLIGSAVAGPVLAQAPPASAPSNPFAGAIRFAGTVASGGGKAIVVKSDQGADVKLTFPDKPNITISNKGTVADLGAGKFVGCTAVERADKLLHATECHIFPESMRGMGEGHNPMGPPNTTMTNGNVTTIANGEVTSKSGEGSATINVAYKGGQQSIHVGPDANITMITAGTVAMVKPGVKVAGLAKPGSDNGAEVMFMSLTP
jgi:hypothetical protein